MIPHEMSERFMRMDLTAREFKVVWFLIRELHGWSMKQRIIKTQKFITDTGLVKQSLIPTIQSLIQKGVIQRFDADGEPGEYVYFFNESNFSTTHATEEVRVDPKVSSLLTYKSMKHRPQSQQVVDSEVSESLTHKTQETTPSAPTRVPKESLKEREINLKSKIEDCFTLLGPAIVDEAEHKRLALFKYREKLR